MNKQLRQFTGTVVSDKMDKTVVVKVERTVMHPKYGKRYIVSRRFHAHDPQNQYHTGDQVVIAAMRPLSRLKRWKVVQRV